MNYFSLFNMTKLKYSHIFNILNHVIKKEKYYETETKNH